MKVRLTIVIIFVFISGLTYSQVTQEWVRNYHGPLNKGAKGIKTMSYGNSIYVFGKCDLGIGINLTDLCLIKYNSNGAEEWIAFYNNPDDRHDIPVDMDIDNLGNIYVTGYTETPSATYFTTIKYNSLGQQIWVKSYNPNPPSPFHNTPQKIIVDDQYNVYVCALFSVPGDIANYLVVKYSPSGNEEWARNYSNGSDFPHDMDVDQNGNVYVTGRCTDSSDSSSITTLKLNSSGVQQWVRKYNTNYGGGYDYPIEIEVDFSNNIVISGSYDNYTAQPDILVFKYSPEGSIIWQRIFGIESREYFYGLTIDPNDNIYVINSRFIPDSSGTLTTKFDSAGIIQWSTLSSINIGSRDLVVDNLENVYITGSHSIVANTNFDYLTIKFNSNGNEEWITRHNGNRDSHDEAVSLCLDNFNNVYVTGDTRDTAFLLAQTTIKYSQSTGIQTLSNELPQKFSLSQNYPNPFNPSTNIKFEIAKATNVKLVIYDALGREVKVIANETMQPGSYNANFDAENLSSGIYFYSLTTSEFTETKRMILLK